MSWCEECGKNTLELCDHNYCRYCCTRLHEIEYCDRFDGEWHRKRKWK